jgi:hypothetical protein
MITEGTRIRRTDSGTVGVAATSPGLDGMFWANFPEGRVHTWVGDVEVVPAP